MARDCSEYKAWACAQCNRDGLLIKLSRGQQQSFDGTCKRTASFAQALSYLGSALTLLLTTPQGLWPVPAMTSSEIREAKCRLLQTAGGYVSCVASMFSHARARRLPSVGALHNEVVDLPDKHGNC